MCAVIGGGGVCLDGEAGGFCCCSVWASLWSEVFLIGGTDWKVRSTFGWWDEGGMWRPYRTRDYVVGVFLGRCPRLVKVVPLGQVNDVSGRLKCTSSGA